MVRFNVRNKIWLAKKGNTLAMLKVKLEKEGFCPPLDDEGNQIEEEKENEIEKEIDDERPLKKRSPTKKKHVANVANWRRPRPHTDAYPNVPANMIDYFSFW